MPGQSYYIDVFNKGMFLTRDSCPKFANSAGRCPMSHETFKYDPSDAIAVSHKVSNDNKITQLPTNHKRYSIHIKMCDFIYILLLICIIFLVPVCTEITIFP